MTHALSKELASTLMLTLLFSTSALAEGRESDGFFGFLKNKPRVAAPSNQSSKYQQECSACHIAYPAALLPTASWQGLMGSLDKHFGVDASVADADRREISSWLSSHSRADGEKPPQNRITQSAWFKGQHDGELPANVWKRPQVGSPSHCDACHQGAAQGSFDEDSVRIPG